MKPSTRSRIAELRNAMQKLHEVLSSDEVYAILKAMAVCGSKARKEAFLKISCRRIERDPEVVIEDERGSLSSSDIQTKYYDKDTMVWLEVTTGDPYVGVFVDLTTGELHSLELFDCATTQP